MKTVAETLGVARSNLIERQKGSAKPRSRYRKADDVELLPLILAIVDERPSYGYRRTWALLKNCNCEFLRERLSFRETSAEFTLFYGTREFPWHEFRPTVYRPISHVRR